MLNIDLIPHRSAMRAGSADPQKLFVLLKLIPEARVANARPPLAFALVVDTSGSMYEAAEDQKGKQKKIDQAIQAAHTLIDDVRLEERDRLAVVQFSSGARVLRALDPLNDRQPAHAAVEELRKYGGGTRMDAGMEQALQELVKVGPDQAKRAILLTDGQTTNARGCKELSVRFGAANAPIIAIGIGDEYNADLLRDVAEASGGRPYHLQKLGDLPSILNQELASSVREVVTDLQAEVKQVKGVSLSALTRVYPSLAEVTAAEAPYRLGNVAAGDYTMFLLEFTIAGLARPVSRVRLAQLLLHATAPGLQQQDDFSPEDLFVTFSDDERAIAQVDEEVLGYVRQKNVDNLVHQAVGQATHNPAQARQTLQMASNMTQRLGNAAMTQTLRQALDELDQTGKLTGNTSRTMSLGSRTKTVKTGSLNQQGLPSDDEIRRLTGV